MPMATPPPFVLMTSRLIGSPPSSGVQLMVIVPAPGKWKSWARYWSPKP